MGELAREIELLYCQNRQQLFTCALSITRSPARAEDAVHEAFCGLLRLERRPDDLKAYAFRAVRNAALSELRRRPTSDASMNEFIFDPSPSAAQSAEQNEFLREVSQALLEISPDERETVVQHLYGELTFREIATIRDVPMGTIVSWYRRGLEKLRTRLQVNDGAI